ncbi:MAG: 5'-nucleotidase C-terminal domain-containing protein [Holophagales bacterium]|nr:5'-nucleotidase C-terminal domain-containing protein [Holophagales bacterium]
MKKWLEILLSVSLLCVHAAAQGVQGTQEKKIQILATANTGAAILPYDPYSLAAANRGWAKLASAIKAEKNKSEATILVDCGDAIQGSPMAYIYQKMRPGLSNPIVKIMNDLGYRAYTVGAHDFDLGSTFVRAAEKQASFPFLAANVVDRDGKLFFKPFTKISVDGVSIAILGLFVPHAPNLLTTHAQMGLAAKDAIDAAKEWVPKLRGAEKADIVIVMAHTGCEGPYTVPNESSTAISIAEKVPGIDGIIATQGQQQMSTRYKGIPIVQPLPLGQSIASITISLSKQGGRWTVRSSSPVAIPLDPFLQNDTQVLSATEQARLDENYYLDEQGPQLSAPLDGRWSTVEPTQLMQLIHDVQRKATRAQLSAAPSPGARIFIPKGPTSVRQFYALAPNENRVARIRITGAQLRAYLEHSARYFRFSHLPELINRNVPLADYDMVGGCNYALDISRPVGRRVSGLTFEGSPVRDDQVFTMAISTYRLAGGGGFMEAIGFKGQPDMVSRETLRNLLMDHALSKATLDISTPSTWRTIPYLDRERVEAAYR